MVSVVPLGLYHAPCLPKAYAWAKLFRPFGPDLVLIRETHIPKRKYSSAPIVSDNSLLRHDCIESLMFTNQNLTEEAVLAQLDRLQTNQLQ